MKASATATNNLTDKIQFQRLAVRSLKEEIFGTDKVPLCWFSVKWSFCPLELASVLVE